MTRDRIPNASRNARSAHRGTSEAAGLAFEEQWQRIATQIGHALEFVGFWHRMHGTTCKLAAVALKYVEWSPDNAAVQRYLWEVCE